MANIVDIDMLVEDLNKTELMEKYESLDKDNLIEIINMFDIYIKNKCRTLQYINNSTNMPNDILNVRLWFILKLKDKLDIYNEIKLNYQVTLDVGIQRQSVLYLKLLQFSYPELTFHDYSCLHVTIKNKPSNINFNNYYYSKMHASYKHDGIPLDKELGLILKLAELHQIYDIKLISTYRSKSNADNLLLLPILVNGKVIFLYTSNFNPRTIGNFLRSIISYLPSDLIYYDYINL